MPEPHDPADALDAVIALLAEGDHAAADAVAEAIADLAEETTPQPQELPATTTPSHEA